MLSRVIQLTTVLSVVFVNTSGAHSKYVLR